MQRQFNFDSIENKNEKNDVYYRVNPTSGQVTGKFRSLNEPMINKMVQKHNRQKAEFEPLVAFANIDIDDDYSETLTASSEDSPMRPSKRVEKASQLTK